VSPELPEFPELPPVAVFVLLAEPPSPLFASPVRESAELVLWDSALPLPVEDDVADEEDEPPSPDVALDPPLPWPDPPEAVEPPPSPDAEEAPVWVLPPWDSVVDEFPVVLPPVLPPLPDEPPVVVLLLVALPPSPVDPVSPESPEPVWTLQSPFGVTHTT
jgi:hypothetical protein